MTTDIVTEATTVGLTPESVLEKVTTWLNVAVENADKADDAFEEEYYRGAEGAFRGVISMLKLIPKTSPVTTEEVVKTTISVAMTRSLPTRGLLFHYGPQLIRVLY